jgi:catechol 2,3-dioxygenase-like lactoylglutathione lyase family enzyme
VSVTALQHVLILSDDIEATRDFYSAVLGLTVGERPRLPFGGYWLYAGATPCVHVAQRHAYVAHARELGLTGPDPAVASNVDHISFAGSDLDGVRAALHAAGIASVTNEIAASGIEQLFFEDPNGVRLEINVKAVTAPAG